MPSPKTPSPPPSNLPANEAETDAWAAGEDAFPLLHESLTGHPRTEARVAATQTLFSAKTMQADVRSLAAEHLTDVKKRKADAGLFADIITEAGTGAARYEALMAAHTLDEWPLDRLDPVHYAIIWAACAELTAKPDTPTKVILNEYINIAKGFASKPADIGFMNAILDRIAQKIRS